MGELFSNFISTMEGVGLILIIVVGFVVAFVALMAVFYVIDRCHRRALIATYVLTTLVVATIMAPSLADKVWTTTPNGSSDWVSQKPGVTTYSVAVVLSAFMCALGFMLVYSCLQFLLATYELRHIKANQQDDEVEVDN